MVNGEELVEAGRFIMSEGLMYVMRCGGKLIPKYDNMCRIVARSLSRDKSTPRILLHIDMLQPWQQLHPTLAQSLKMMDR